MHRGQVPARIVSLNSAPRLGHSRSTEQASCPSGLWVVPDGFQHPGQWRGWGGKGEGQAVAGKAAAAYLA